MMKLSELIKRLQHIHRKVGDRPVFFTDDYDRSNPVGHAVLHRAEWPHLEWELEGVSEGTVVVDLCL